LSIYSFTLNFAEKRAKTPVFFRKAICFSTDFSQKNPRLLHFPGRCSGRCFAMRARPEASGTKRKNARFLRRFAPFARIGAGSSAPVQGNEIVSVRAAAVPPPFGACLRFSPAGP
jgi:hypothetical protein